MEGTSHVYAECQTGLGVETYVCGRSSPETQDACMHAQIEEIGMHERVPSHIPPAKDCHSCLLLLVRQVGEAVLGTVGMYRCWAVGAVSPGSQAGVAGSVLW